MNINLQYEKIKMSIYNTINNSGLPACLIKEMINNIAQQVNQDYELMLRQIDAEEGVPQEGEEVE